MNPIDIRPFDPEIHRDGCLRIWEEVGWLDRSHERHVWGLDGLFEAGRAYVAMLHDEPECLVLDAEGSLRYLGEDIRFAGITAVTTSRVARRQGIAARLTARLIAEEAQDGVAVSGLGMFEQGFYDRLGFGTGVYERKMRFDPQLLTVPYPERPPRRLSDEDWEVVHACRLARKVEHGYVTFDSPLVTRSSAAQVKGGFGLGFFDGPDGALSHHVWLNVQEAENGPYHVMWMAHRTPEQFLELMGVLRSLGDQVRAMTMCEPSGIQLQDLVQQPIHSRIVTHKARFETGMGALAWWQIRINDVERCLEQTHLNNSGLRFNVELGDPVTSFLDADSEWKGVGGEYVVELGPDSGAERGRDASAPTLKASINAFSRLWLGVRPATGLAVTDDLEGPRDLLEALDEAFRLPEPVRDWDF